MREVRRKQVAGHSREEFHWKHADKCNDEQSHLTSRHVAPFERTTNLTKYALTTREANDAVDRQEVRLVSKPANELSVALQKREPQVISFATAVHLKRKHLSPTIERAYIGSACSRTRSA